MDPEHYKVSKRMPLLMLALTGAFGFFLICVLTAIGGAALNAIGSIAWMHPVCGRFFFGSLIAVALTTLALPGLKLTVCADSQGSEITKRYSWCGCTLYFRHWRKVSVRVERRWEQRAEDRGRAVKITAGQADGRRDVVVSVFEATLFGIERFWTAK